MLEIIIIFVFVWLMLHVLTFLGMVIGSLSREAQEKERRAIAQFRRTKEPKKEYLIKPGHVKIVFYPLAFFGVLSIFLSQQ